MHDRTTRRITAGVLTLVLGIACNEDTPDEPAPPEVVEPVEIPDAPAKPLDDAAIARAVEHQLRFDAAIPSHAIDVRSTAGVVELTGVVPHLLAKDRAVRIATLVKGVRSVSDRVRVEAPNRPDLQIETDVRTALLYDPATEAFEISVDVEDQVATLRGEVDSYAEREIALQLAKAVEGVERVVDEISIAYDRDRSDLEIESEIEEVLRWDALVDAGMIRVTVDDGIVKLDGTVGSAAERGQATASAWVAGVRDVDASGLDVRWWAGDSLRQPPVVDDGEVREAVMNAMAVDPRVGAHGVEPRVDAGRVTLHGAVDTPRAKRAAEQVARTTVGVVAVENELEIRPTDPPGDDEIEEAIRERLRASPLVRTHVDVDVDRGIVTLSGTVETVDAKMAAEDIAMTRSGVLSVINQLKPDTDRFVYYYEPYVYPHVTPWVRHVPVVAALPDDVIRRNIHDELFWSPFVDAEEVVVEVDNGSAVLKGRVDSARERDAAVENAFEGGAIAVSDQLEIQPDGS